MLAAVAIACVIAIGRPHRSARYALDDGWLRVVVLGDSVAHGAGDETGGGIERSLDSQFRARSVAFVPAVNYGINGARTRDALRLLQSPASQIALRTADVVVVSIGGNDLYGDSIARLRSTIAPAWSMRRVLEHVAGIVARIHAINPDTKIMLLGLYNPYRSKFLDEAVNRWDSMLIARFAEDRRVTTVRIADLFGFADRLSSIDHFHPSAGGYALIAARIAPALAR